MKPPNSPRLFTQEYELPSFANESALAHAATNRSGFEAPFASIPLLSSWQLPPVAVISSHPAVATLVALYIGQLCQHNYL